MPKHGKKYREVMKLVDRTKRYGLDEGLELLKKISYSKFDSTVEVAIRLGIDPRKADQMVRGSAVMPFGVGKTVRVLVFAKGEKEIEAREAGADFVGAEDMVAKIKEGWMDFDKVIAAPNMMGLVGPIGKILGPRGLMPNPKVGTVTMEVGRAVRELKAGRVEFRTEKKGALIQCGIGKASFPVENIKGNFMSLLEAVLKAKPASAKGSYIKTLCLSSTMSPGIKLDPSVASESTKP